MLQFATPDRSTAHCSFPRSIWERASGKTSGKNRQSKHKERSAMIYLDLIILIVIVSVVSIWLDRRFVRNRNKVTDSK
jgi:flagellar biogenesis protein FliO